MQSPIKENNMKKIYDNWRVGILNEFAPSYSLEDEEAGIEQYITPVSDLVQKAIQAVIDTNKGLHASGRPIDPKLLQGLLNENDIKELIDSMRGLSEDDYLRKLSLHPGFFDFVSGHINNIRKIFNMAEASKGKTFLTADISLVTYMTSSPFMKEKEFIQYRDNIRNATEAFGHLLRSNRYEIIHSIRLFTGESVSTARSPSKFKSELARPMEEDDQSKKELLKALLPSFTISSDKINHEVNSVFSSILYHVNITRSPSIMNSLKRATTEEGKKLLTAYFDKLIEISKSEEMQKELNLMTKKKQQIKKIAQSVGFSTKSRKYQEFMRSLDRVRAMLPLYDLFFKHYREFLAIPTQDDYEQANMVLKALSKKKVKGDYLIYRGMYAKGSGGPIVIEEGMEFDFHDISSWSTDRRTARGFIEATGGGTKLLFSMKPKRGTYIDYYSAFEGEKEFLTGGKVKIVSVTTRESAVGPFATREPTFLVRCEQI
jgi:hypothetical protein